MVLVFRSFVKEKLIIYSLRYITSIGFASESYKDEKYCKNCVHLLSLLYTCVWQWKEGGGGGGGEGERESEREREERLTWRGQHFTTC